ncbi:hypothetical protein [Pseudomonas phage vB_PaeM_PAO1_Ab17]|uniref:Uncharacterized protein n=2 Tax=Nankokuvirus Ab03 TaxID=1925780 RepID=A0A0A1IWI1_9CAUD|nr:structural protein [Pseudomonas phage vB_PaeM_PAO1_Ab03]WKW88896.1 structural protein [Pseudomonas phage LSL4]CEF89185.1 hypothetical protein [Pseudomonas phage vB_PaeM_PAO1_Ab03]CEF89569.1 hypothetical protein [Pseudomonas phage vB_PaeM_PAO1_Ab17]
MLEKNQFRMIDFLKVAQSRYTEQFKKKPIFDKFVELLLQAQVELQEVMRQVQQERTLDTAVGAQLDVLGEIVGLPRSLVTAEIFKFFGYKDRPDNPTPLPTPHNAGPYGSLNDPSVGAPWWGLGQATEISREATDEEYRLMIKAKILKNRTLSTPEDVIEAYKFLFGASQIIIDELGNANCRIGIGKILSTVERGLLFELGNVASLLPKTLGVNYTYSEFSADRPFATEGFQGGFGTGDLNDPSVGGILSNLLT